MFRLTKPQSLGIREERELAINVNANTGVGNKQHARLEPTKRTVEMVERLPGMRPDFYKSTIKRFGGDHERWGNWAAGYMQFLMNQIMSMIENAGKR